MEVLLVLVPFLFFGIVVLFIAFSGGPAAAREAYLTRGGRFFKIAIPVLYVGARHRGPGGRDRLAGRVRGRRGKLRSESLNKQDENGKVLFVENCWSCHNLDAVGAEGVTGPDLDTLGCGQAAGAERDQAGGTGDGRMPAGLLVGQDADDVAGYVPRSRASDPTT